jgi:uncharacterized repeat protein (TIGR01451 family)
MFKRALPGLTLLVVLIAAAPASAVQSPAGCTGNHANVSIDRDRGVPIYANGETIKYQITVTNNDPGSCDVDGVTLVLHLPAADGTPTGQAVTAVTGLAMPAGTAKTVVSTIPYKLAVNPGVTDAVAQIQATAGLLHDAPNDHQYRELKEVGTDVVKPTITIDKTGSISSGQAPQNVTYTYEVTNTSPIAIPLNKVRVTDNLCTNPVYARGDNGDGLLTQNEKWWFTCSMLHATPGSYLNTAKACAVSAIDSNNEEICSPPDTWTVTLTPPPAPPAVLGAVKPQSVANEACTLSTPSGLKVRKGEVTTVKLTVRNVDAGSVARITLPGGKVLSAKTNSKGVATFKVKPTRTGRATIRAAECADVERFSVLAARKTAAQRVPRVTG